VCERERRGEREEREIYHSTMEAINVCYSLMTGLGGCVQAEQAEIAKDPAYRAVLYSCVGIHWLTLLTACQLISASDAHPLVIAGTFRFSFFLLTPFSEPL
jgi:hypothetical protein